MVGGKVSPRIGNKMDVAHNNSCVGNSAERKKASLLTHEDSEMRSCFYHLLLKILSTQPHSKEDEEEGGFWSLVSQTNRT